MYEWLVLLVVPYTVLLLRMRVRIEGIEAAMIGGPSASFGSLKKRLEDIEAKYEKLYKETRVYFVQPVMALRDPRPSDSATHGKVWLNMKLRSSWTYQGEDGRGSHIWRKEEWMA
jgi:hypothetical protein